MADSSISKFFEKSLKERLDVVADFSSLSQDELKIIEDATGGISYDDADGMIENAIGTFSLPLGIATNFQINDKDYLIPMVIEEPSVIAASSKAAKIARVQGGFKAEAKKFLSNPDFNLVVLDEITYMINYKYLEEKSILKALSNRPANQHVVITGRAASDNLIEAADTVSEILDIKHAFRANIKAQKGLDL